MSRNNGEMSNGEGGGKGEESHGEGNQGRLSLKQQICLQIEAQGPISLATYMRACLTHPTSGYYKTADPLGKTGDFITAPEISQLFGEMVGAWVLIQWHALDCPQEFELVELGPGRGTLMADALRVISRDKQAISALRLTLLETSPVLMAQQGSGLGNFNPRWITEIGELEGASSPVIVIANEFFDALPIHQYQFRHGNWHERLIGLDGKNLVWGLSPSPMPAAVFPSVLAGVGEGEIWETCPLAHQSIARLAELVKKCGGALIAIDYGYEKTRTGDSLQAVARHAFADPLSDPGKVDLSAHVDFEALIAIARKRGVSAELAGTQGQFLSGLGIVERAQRLMAANPKKAQTIKSGLERLIDPAQMGDLFKVMVMYAPGHTPPFEQDEELAAQSGITHGFFGRRGGVSTGDFASLNASLSTRDDSAHVDVNRARILGALHGGAPELAGEEGLAGEEELAEAVKLATLRQVHSSRVVTVDEGFDFASPPEADGLVTNRPGVALGILTADCTPVLFADAEAGIIGACHAGWRGAVDGVIANTVVGMEELGANPGRIISAIGPTIWAQNYEVGPDFARDFAIKHPDKTRFIVKADPGAREHFDLPGFVMAELKAAGIIHVGQVGGCTYAHPERYFSHRFSVHKAIEAGRQLCVIMLK